MGLLDLFKPSPFIQEIKDKKVVDKKYWHWRIRVFYSMYIGYAFFYFTRKSFTFAMPAMIQDLGFDKAELGMRGSILTISYGLSKFVSGIMSDRSNPRYFMSIGLILTGVFNILFGFSSTLILFAIFWGLNGWFQGWGWPPCAKLLTHWYSQSERGRWWSIWNTSHNVGGFIIPIVASAIAQYVGWRYSMYVPGVACIMVGFFLLNRLRDTPQSLGLPPIEKFKDDYPTSSHRLDKRERLTTKEILFEYVLKNKYVWILSIAYLFVYIVRTAINDWSLVFLVETKGYSLVKAGIAVSWFEVGGFFGSLAAGWSSDYLFKGKRGPVNTIFAALVAVAVFAMWKDPYEKVLVDSIIIFFIGFFVFGPQMMIGMAVAELSHKKAAGTATGFAAIFAYVFGATIAGGPLGRMIDKLGWNGFFIIVFTCALLSVAFLLPLWNVKANTHSN